MSVYTKPGNGPVTLFRGKIISLRLPYLLFCLCICQAIDQPHLHWSHTIIKGRFGSVSYRITMFKCETKRYGLFWISPADAEPSRVVLECWSRAYRIHPEPYKRNPNPIWKGIRYEGDPVSCKQGPSCFQLYHYFTFPSFLTFSLY